MAAIWLHGTEETIACAVRPSGWMAAHGGRQSLASSHSFAQTLRSFDAGTVVAPALPTFCLRSGYETRDLCCAQSAQKCLSNKDLR
jgi:hypothetical protein